MLFGEISGWERKWDKRVGMWFVNHLCSNLSDAKLSY